MKKLLLSIALIILSCSPEDSCEPIYVSSNADGANAGWVNFVSTGNYSGYVGLGSFGIKFNVKPVRKF